MNEEVEGGARHRRMMDNGVELEPGPKPALGVWARVGLFLIAYVLLSLGGQVVLLVVTWQTEQPPGLVLGWYSANALLFMGLTAALWTRIDRRPWREIGFQITDGGAWRKGLLLGALLAVPGWALAMLFGHIQWVGWAVPDAGEGTMRVLLHLGSALAAAVSVELPYRGYLIGTLAERLSHGRLVLVTAVLYVVGHLWLPPQQDPLNMIQTLLFGAGLAYLRLATGSLALPVAVSAFVNLKMLLIASDPWIQPVIAVRYAWPSLWFGSDEWYEGLVGLWVTLCWLTGVYAWVYRPAATLTLRANMGGGGSGEPSGTAQPHDRNA